MELNELEMTRTNVLRQQFCTLMLAAGLYMCVCMPGAHQVMHAFDMGKAKIKQTSLLSRDKQTVDCVLAHFVLD